MPLARSITASVGRGGLASALPFFFGVSAAVGVSGANRVLESGANCNPPAGVGAAAVAGVPSGGLPPVGTRVSAPVLTFFTTSAASPSGGVRT